MLLAATASQRLDKNYPTLYTVGALMNCILVCCEKTCWRTARSAGVQCICSVPTWSKDSCAAVEASLCFQFSSSKPTIWLADSAFLCLYSPRAASPSFSDNMPRLCAGSQVPCGFSTSRAGYPAQPSPGQARCIFCAPERLEQILEDSSGRSTVIRLMCA